MNFIKFSTGTTNIFPLANSTTGGQLMTEYNLRSRESVKVGPIDHDNRIQYMVGESFVNSEDDFKLSKSSSGDNQIFEISSGRAVINGHFFESLVPVTINLAEANTTLRKNAQPGLKGDLVVGLRAMYSTEKTMAGAMLKENKTEYFEGVQVVVCSPRDFVLPEDSPDDESKVTAHIKLGQIYYSDGNGQINDNIIQNADKCRYIDANRIKNIADITSDTYISRTGLNPGKIYGFSGKGDADKDTWCDLLDSLIVWDRAYARPTTNKPSVDSAQFGTYNGRVVLHLPHKQVDGMVDANNNRLYYPTKVLELPRATYSGGEAGTIDYNYTKAIKDQFEAIHTKMLQGKQRGYVPVIDSVDRQELPPVNTAWDLGDYILVGTDNSVVDSATTNLIKSPSTLYVVVDGVVTSLDYKTSKVDDSSVPNGLGMQMKRFDWYDSKNDPIPSVDDSDTWNNQLEVATGNYIGTVGKDYILVTYAQADGDGNIHTTYYYYVVKTNTGKRYSDPIFLTGEVQLATEDTIGGFLNVPDTALDAGYIYRDDTGHLRLLDYALLRSGTLAYQLATDQSYGDGLTSESIQEQLDEYVNDRVAFPSADKLADSKYDGRIFIALELPKEEDATTITIRNIDSRFGTAVHIHLSGTADSHTTINIENCEKIRVDYTFTAENGDRPTLNIKNCNLYYDAYVLSCATKIEGMTLWYKKYDSTDPNITVSGMKVISLDEVTTVKDIDLWNESVDNDIHYNWGLKSVTFGSDGYVLGFGILVRNETTANVSLGKSIIVSKFKVPQSNGLSYPISRVNKQVKISGTFESAYANDSPQGYLMMTTNFTALSQYYDATTETEVDGQLSIFMNAENITNVVGVNAGEILDGWSTDSYHPFEGVIV